MLLKHLITMLQITYKNPLQEIVLIQAVDKALEQHKLKLDFNED